MIKLLITAPSSNTGKTAVTCGLLSLLDKKGYNPCSFKCGPDYIDPMFHRSVLGVKSCNLDMFLASKDRVKEIYEENVKGHGAAACEGVMGFYDGMKPGSDEASAYDVSKTLDFPAILVVRPKGAALTLAAVIRGMAEFRKPNMIKGVILNDCSEMFYKTYGPAIEKESGVPLIGYLPHMEEAVFESRHLGLYTAQEIDDLSARIGRIADTMEKTIDFDKLKSIYETPDLAKGAADSFKTSSFAKGAADEPDEHASCDEKASSDQQSGYDRSCYGDESISGFVGENAENAENGGNDENSGKVRIAVASDEAFCFNYYESLNLLKKLGAELVDFSPIHDSEVPAGVQALYLPGGYPELFAKELEENASMRESIRKLIEAGLPTIAECGGFLYLGKTLEGSDGREYEAAGVLPGHGKKGGHLVRFGYAYITSDSDSMLLRRGEKIPEHEFHYWDSTDNGSALTAAKMSGKSWKCGFTSPTLFAGFPHLYMAGTPVLAERFIEAAKKYGKGNN